MQNKLSNESSHSNDLHFPVCRYGDRIDDCYSAHPSECYDVAHNEECCRYCQHKERPDYPSKKAGSSFICFINDREIDFYFDSFTQWMLL